MKKLASQLDVLSIKRKVASINLNVDESDVVILNKLDEVNTNISNLTKSTKEAVVAFTNLNANSVDFGGGLAGVSSWGSPYVVNKWHQVVNVTGKGEINYISFASSRGGTFTQETGKLSFIKCTIDGVEIFSKSTEFFTQDSATSREYLLLGVCIGTTRLSQIKLYFNKTLLIEVYSEYTVQPKPVAFINYQLY